MNINLKLSTLIGLALAGTSAHASGPLIISDETGVLKPVVWVTSNGPIPVYTDGGGAFTYDFDGVTPFITLERANQITAESFLQWSQVPTSTFAATIQGTIAGETGVADVTSANIDQFIGVENGPGFWVIYDTDGSIMEDFFGVPNTAVLGISTPEYGDGNGHITESWTVMNGWAVDASDTGTEGPVDPDRISPGDFDTFVPRGSNYAGVFTHEIGHAINLSHSQTNGQMAYQSYTYAPLYPGAPGCVEPLYSYTDFSADPADMIDAASIETMFPFIDSSGIGGAEQSTVNISDDVIGISNLYPTADYLANTGSISGVLRLKDGVTQYSGINVIARNVANPYFDAVSDMTGSATQGQLGPDGRFTIRGLTPGASYQLYIEEIIAGGYPTTPQPLVSEGEYWNTAEASNPITDAKCDATSIVATAAATGTADITFNGFADGIQFTPIVSAFLSSLSTDGSRAGGSADGGLVAIRWDKLTGLEVLPEGMGTNNGNIDGPGTRMAIQHDPDGNGIAGPAIWNENGAIQNLGDLNGDTCGSDSQSGTDSAIAWGMDRSASKVVGLGYIDRDVNGSCGGGYDEIVPFIWDSTGGMRELQHDPDQPWTRANTVSGNGRVVLGVSNFQNAWAWVDEGAQIDLTALTGAQDANAVNFDGSVVAVSGFDEDTYRNTGILAWNPWLGTGPNSLTNIDSLRYCVDLPYLSFFGDNLCETMTAEEVYDMAGSVPVDVFSVNDAGTVMVGRAGSFFTGTYGALWVKDIGWTVVADFLRRQGVVEASSTPIDNPFAVSGVGDTIMGGIAGYSFTWMIDLHQVYACKNGQSIRTTFPDGLRAEVINGAEAGRCEFID